MAGVFGAFFCLWRVPIATRLNRYVCPACGAAYPTRGTCYGRGPDKHEPTRVVQD